MSDPTFYAEWIREHVTEPDGRCADKTLEMAEAFPELRRVRGHYCDPFQGERPHWWLVDPNGRIIDPTAAQFSGMGAYIERDESQPEPSGKCVNCGGLVYGRDGMLCSDICADAYARYCTGA